MCGTFYLPQRSDRKKNGWDKYAQKPDQRDEGGRNETICGKN